MRIRFRRRRRKVSSLTLHYKAHKKPASAYIKARTRELSEEHGFLYKRIAIRNTRRSWGSCSELGNLNFSYKLLFLPQHLSDYIIVHELCHLRELNHSKAFWAEVARIMPDYRTRIQELKAIKIH